MKEAAIMADIVKMYRQELPAFRFIGKKYGDGDRVNGGFGSQWGEWFQNGWFEALEKLPGGGEALCEDGSAYLGLMRSNVWLTGGSMLAGKTLRYIVVLATFQGAASLL